MHPINRVLMSLLALSLCIPATGGQGMLRQRLKERLGNKSQDQTDNCEKIKIAGLNVAVWVPTQSKGPYPLVIFSHGLHGINTQSVFLTKAMADAGYLVMAPNHHDAMGSSGMLARPEERFGKPSDWSDSTYKDRGADITNLVAALHQDQQWNARIDWSHFALAGHSLGGYTALALAGGWPSWKLPDVKAVLALSPYAMPFVTHDTFKDLHVPVMYQGGTRDFGITPFLKRSNGIYSHTLSPAYFVEFDKASHFSFSSLNKDTDMQHLINFYSIAFLNKYVLGDTTAKPEQKLAGVTELDVK